MNTNKNATFKQSFSERQNPPTEESVGQQMYYYAFINEGNVCTGVYSLPTQMTSDNYIAITEEQYNSQSVVGMRWNAETETWESPLIFSCTTDDVDYKGTGVLLTSKLDSMDTAIAGKANVEHTHTEYAAVDHTHTGYATTSEMEALETVVDGKANINHTHSDYATVTALNEKADATHSHGNATASVSGFLSKSDKSKLDGVETGANKTIVDTALSSTSSNPVQNKVVYSALSGKANTSHTHTLDDVSETTNKKVMTAAERTKLSGIETGANKYTHPSTHAASVITGLSSVATSGKYSDLTNIPTSFVPSTHTHAQSDITGLSTALNGKADANHTHNYCTLNQVYPVGSIYLSVNSANPSTLFGGTWAAFGTGKVLMGVKSGGSAEATGGSETATISAHTHTTANHKLTIEEMPPHHHEILNYNENGVTTDTFTKNSVEGLIKKGWTGNVMTSYTGGNQAHSHGNTGSAGGSTISVVQPYITCYMWKRTT